VLLNHPPGHLPGTDARPHRDRLSACARHDRVRLADRSGPGTERQAEILATVIEVVARDAGALNVAGCTHLSLRDAWSAEPGRFCQFGLMTDGYVPKPVFRAYRNLIAALGRPGTFRECGRHTDGTPYFMP
jgi:hypothetical protein